ncbi:hypothetical protein [Spirosoma litoris]
MNYFEKLEQQLEKTVASIRADIKRLREGLDRNGLRFADYATLAQLEDRLSALSEFATNAALTSLAGELAKLKRIVAINAADPNLLFGGRFITNTNDDEQFKPNQGPMREFFANGVRGIEFYNQSNTPTLIQGTLYVCNDVPINPNLLYRLRFDMQGINYTGSIKPYFHILDESGNVFDGMYINGQNRFPKGKLVNTIAVSNSLYTVDFVFGGIGTVANAQFQVQSRKIRLAFQVNFESMADVLRVSNLSIVPVDQYVLIPINQAASVPAGVLMQDQANSRLAIKDSTGQLKYIALT